MINPRGGAARAGSDIDLFVVVIEHCSCRLVHYNVTAHPSAARTLQQLRDAVGYEERHRFLIKDGYTFLETRRRLEQQQNLPRIPAVAVTAFALPEDRDRAIASGFYHHLATPLDGEKLAAVLAQLVE